MPHTVDRSPTSVAELSGNEQWEVCPLLRVAGGQQLEATTCSGRGQDKVPKEYSFKKKQGEVFQLSNTFTSKESCSLIS